MSDPIPVHYHHEPSGQQGEATWPEIVAMVNSGVLSPSVLVYVNGGWITFAAANAPAGPPPSPREASELREHEELLQIRTEWEDLDRSLARLIAGGVLSTKEWIEPDLKARLIMAIRRGETVEAALLRLRPDLDKSTETQVAPPVSSGLRRATVKAAVLLRRVLDALSDRLGRFVSN